jgi:REase_DpnII-MboI
MPMNRSVGSLIEGLASIARTYPADGANQNGVLVTDVLAALNSFSDIVRYLNTRRSKAASLELSDEAAVQDALFLMLRPLISDLTPENPTDKVGGRYAIKDFVSHASRIVIEAKYIRDRQHGRTITQELNDDIETYRYHRSCDDLVFFIYDPDSYIPDKPALERHLQTARTYEGKVLRCHAVIKP